MKKEHKMHSGMNGHHGHSHGGPESMPHEGYVQGDMNPKVEDYQKPMKAFAETGFTKTTEYIERQNRFQDEMASGIEKQHYKGRYS